MSISLSQVTQYLSLHPDQMSQQRNLFPPEKIMMLINPKSLDKLKLEFEGHPQGLSLESFLWLMSNVIDHKLQDRYQLLYCLSKLYNEIDINLNKTLEWRQLISYIIEEVKSHTERPPTTITLQKLSKSKQLQATLVLKPPSYQQSKQLQGKDSDISSIIKKIVIIDSLKVISILSVRMSSVKMYSDEDLHFKPEYTLQFDDQNIVDYVVGNNCIILVGDKSTVKFYDIDQDKLTLTCKNKQTLLVQPLKIWYLPLHNLFLTTDHQYKIRNLVKPIRRYDNGYVTSTEICFTAHNSMITNIEEIKTPYCIVTSSMDGKIKLWDVFKATIITEIVVTSAERAIKNIGIVDGSIIYSWGYENLIQLWIPDKSLIKPYVGQLDVRNMVIDVCTVVGQAIIISLDTKNLLKVWQIRKLQCIQTIQASKSIGIQPFKKSFITFNCTITFYNRKNELKILDQQKIPLGGFFNFTYSSFIVVAPKQIRSYDAKTGVLKALYNYSVHRQQQTSISCFMKTSNQRKLYIGDKDGNITIFNSETGEVLRKVKQGDINNQIQSLVYINSQNTILAGSSKLQTFDQQDGITTSLIKDVVLPLEVRQIDYNQNIKAFLLTSSKGYSIWSFQTFKLMYDEEISADIVSAKWVEGYYGYIVVVRKFIRLYSITHDLRVSPQWVRDLTLKNSCQVALTIQHNFRNQQEQKESQKSEENKKHDSLLSHNIEGINVYSYFGQILKLAPLIKHCYLVLGFTTGQIGIIDLTQIAIKHKLVYIEQPIKMTSFQFRRKQFIKQKFKQFKYTKQPKYESSAAEFLTVFGSHSTPISSISYTDEIDCFTVCGEDQLIKVIDFKGNIHCVLDAYQMRASKWNLPFSWIDLKLGELNQVITIAEWIGDKEVIKSDKEELKCKTLKKMYFQQREAFNLINYGYRPEMEMTGRESPIKEYKIKKPQQLLKEIETTKVNKILNSQLSSKLELRIDSKLDSKYAFTSKSEFKTNSLFKNQSKTKQAFAKLIVIKPKSKSKLDNRISPDLLRQKEKAQPINYTHRPILRMSLKQFRKNNGIKIDTVPANFMKTTLSTKFLKSPEIESIRSRTLSKRSLRQESAGSQVQSKLLKKALRLPDQFANIDEGLYFKINQSMNIQKN